MNNQHDEDQYIGRDPKTIVLEAFRLIRNIHDTMSLATLLTWSPVLVHNALYAAGLGCLRQGSTFYVEKKKPAKKKELTDMFGIDFHNDVSTRNFLLLSDGGPVSRYPVEVPALVLVDGAIKDAAYLKKLEWKEVEYEHPSDDTLNPNAGEKGSPVDFKAIDFWDVMTRVCDPIYMGGLVCSKPLEISPEELGTLEFLTFQLRNPTVHVQPNLFSILSKQTTLNAVKVVQQLTIRLCGETYISVDFDRQFVDELRGLAL